MVPDNIWTECIMMEFLNVSNFVITTFKQMEDTMTILAEVLALKIILGVYKTFKFFKASHNNMGLDTSKPVFGVCQRCRPACTSMQSDQHLFYSLIAKNHIITCYE